MNVEELKEVIHRVLMQITKSGVCRGAEVSQRTRVD